MHGWIQRIDRWIDSERERERGKFFPFILKLLFALDRFQSMMTSQEKRETRTELHNNEEGEKEAKLLFIRSPKQKMDPLITDPPSIQGYKAALQCMLNNVVTKKRT